MDAQQPPAQSPLISSSGSPPPPQEEDEEPRRPWEEDDFGDEVLDLTGGAGGFSHPPFSVRFPAEPPARGPPEEEEEDSRRPAWEEARESPQPSAPEEEVPPDRRPTAPVITPLAPLQPAAPRKEEAPPAVPRRGSSGSADETLFALPAASASLMHSSAEQMMDLQEQPYSSVSPGQEEFTSLLHETSASVPSLSPLSAYPVKDHTFTDSSLAQSPFAGVLQEPLSKMYLESAGDSLHTIKTENGDYLKLEQTETQPPLLTSPNSEAMSVDHIENETVHSHGTEQLNQITSKLEITLLDESSKALLSEAVQTGESGAHDHVFKVAFEEESPVRAEYADFKPFAPILEKRIVDQEACHLDDIFKSNVDSLKGVGTEVLATEQYHEMDKTSTHPQSISDPSQLYETSATSQIIASADEDAVLSCPPQHDLISENKTDENKIAEMAAQFSTEQSASTVPAASLFSEELEGEEAGYVTKDSSSKTSAATVTSMSESLTPDLVQEACESEIHDAAGAQLTYTSQIDLVQTSELLPEPSICVGQISPSFELMESIQSTVLPDIVMEAPLSTGAVGIETTSLYITQPDVSALEDTAPLVHEEQIKRECEKPPSYEEAVKVPLTRLQKNNADSFAFKESAHVESTAFEEIETPYISIACDLVKETKTSNESLPPEFMDFSKNVLGDFASQSEHTKKDEDSSPESEEIDFYGQSVSEVMKNTIVIASSGEEKAAEAMSYSIIGNESKESFTDLSPAKAYMESFQPEFDLPKDTTALLINEPTVAISNKEEKPLQMEELGNVIYSEQDLSADQEHRMKEASLCAGELAAAPIMEDFMTALDQSKDAKLVLETDYEMGRKYQMESVRNRKEVEARQVPVPEIPCDASSLKDIPVKAQEKLKSWEYSPDTHDVFAVPLLPKEEVSPAHVFPKELVSSSREEIVSEVKYKVLAKEVATEHSNSEEKSERKKVVPLVAAASVLSAKLGQISVVDLLYWRDIKKTGVVFGASLFLLLSLTVFSIVSVSAYIALALLSVTISYRIYKGVFQAIQKSDEGHPFRAYLESDVAVSEELVQKYSNVALGHINCTMKELRRLFLVEDLVDSLKFAVLMWVFTYVGALFNGLTLLILALVSLFSIPVIYERHQTQIDHYLGLVNKNVRDVFAKIQAKIPGLKRKAE